MADPPADDPTTEVSTDSTEAIETTAVTSNYKVLGELTDAGGVGVLGQNDADSGTPIGVQGAVPNADGGFGLETPDDARVEGDLEATSGHALTVDGTSALRLGPTGTDGDGNAAGGTVIGGHQGNDVHGAVGTTIGGGGSSAFSNDVLDDYGTVGGGEGNRAGDFQSGTTNAIHATVGGGYVNVASGDRATVGGGRLNLASGGEATVGGGGSNEARAQSSAIGGGFDNRTGKSGTSKGTYATVPGGSENVAEGDHSFAAGKEAKATHEGAFVWADATSGSVTSTASDQFIVDADGGVGIGTESPEAPLDVAGGNWNLSTTEGDLKIGDDTYRFNLGVALGGAGAGSVNMRAKGGAERLNLGSGGSNVVTVNETDGVYPVVDDTYPLGKSGNRWTEVWATNGAIQTSDARLKTNVADLEDGLDRLTELRPVTYEWDRDDPTMGGDDRTAASEAADGDGADEERSTRLGLIAQEVADVVPEAVVDPDEEDGYLGLNYETLVPVLVDAVQAQQAIVESQREAIRSLREAGDRRAERIADLEGENDHLRERNDALAERVAAVEDRLRIDAEGGTPPAAD